MAWLVVNCDLIFAGIDVLEHPARVMAMLISARWRKRFAVMTSSVDIRNASGIVDREYYPVILVAKAALPEIEFSEGALTVSHAVAFNARYGIWLGPCQSPVTIGD